MKYFIALLLVATPALASHEAFVVTKPAVLKLCNPVSYSYCPKTPVYGEGYGMIEIDGVTLPVWPNGKDKTRAAIMSGKLQAFITIQNREHKDSTFYVSSQFKATGYIGKSQFGKMIFNLIAME